MEPIIIEQSKTYPAVNFNFDAGEFEIKGHCTPENATEFFSPLLTKFQEYLKSPQSSTVLRLHFSYLNTSASKQLLHLFKLLQEVHKRSTEVLVYWIYEEGDDDMRDAGSDYEMLMELPFKLVEVKESEN